MKPITGTVALAIVLTACSGGGGSSSDAKTTATFVTATQSAWQSAALVSTSSATGEQQAAAAWSAFAFTVGHMNAGKDGAQQGQLVALAQQASTAYTADYSAFQCQTSNAFNTGYQSPAACPPSPGSPDDVVSQIRDLVQAL